MNINDNLNNSCILITPDNELVDIITNKYFTFIQIPKTGSTTIFENARMHFLTKTPKNNDFKLNRKKNEQA
tara:strand:+ start:743 stop:955 length:213 start_codon:yes stop_codon:yes gene_type:complete